MIQLWMILNMLVSHPKLDVLYNPFLNGYVSSKLDVLYHPNLDDLVSRLKMDFLCNPNLDDSEHACKSSKSGCFVQSNFGWFWMCFYVIQKWMLLKKLVWYKTSTLGWLTSTFRIIQIWITQNIRFQVTYRIIQIWMISSTFQLYWGEARDMRACRLQA